MLPDAGEDIWKKATVEKGILKQDWEIGWKWISKIYKRIEDKLMKSYGAQLLSAISYPYLWMSISNKY